MISKYLCVGLATVCLQISAIAATFSSKCDAQIEKVAGCTIIMTGEIVKGDNQRLIDLLRAPKSSGSSFYRTILLQSMGGSISESLLIAQTVTQNVLDTQTVAYWRKEYPLSKSHCVSACFLIWVAGADRLHFSSPSRNGENPVGLGLHRPYFAKEDFAKLDPLTAAKSQQDLIAQVRGYLKRQEMPDRLIDEMIKRSSKEIYWLNSLENPAELELGGKSPWFEELMISRCGLDPNVEKDDQMDAGKEIAAGKSTDTTKRRRYLVWRQNYNACEYEFRKASQAKFTFAK